MDWFGTGWRSEFGRSGLGFASVCRERMPTDGDEMHANAEKPGFKTSSLLYKVACKEMQPRNYWTPGSHKETGNRGVVRALESRVRRYIQSWLKILPTEATWKYILWSRKKWNFTTLATWSNVKDEFSCYGYQLKPDLQYAPLNGITIEQMLRCAISLQEI